MTHTPGPWYIAAYRHPADDTADKYLITSKSRAIAELVGGRESDARLIAAAPDLLAALESFPWPDRPSDPKWLSKVVKWQNETAYDAIIKAKGVTP